MNFHEHQVRLRKITAYKSTIVPEWAWAALTILIAVVVVALVIWTAANAEGMSNTGTTFSFMSKPNTATADYSNLAAFNLLEHQRAAVAVARYYELTRDQVVLLLAVYDHETAPRKQRVTCSYFGIKRSIRPIIAYAQNDRQEFLVCATIAARLIRDYCPDTSDASLKGFNHGVGKFGGYAVDRDWWLKVKRHMRKYQNIVY